MCEKRVKSVQRADFLPESGRAPRVVRRGHFHDPAVAAGHTPARDAPALDAPARDAASPDAGPRPRPLRPPRVSLRLVAGLATALAVVTGASFALQEHDRRDLDA